MTEARMVGGREARGISWAYGGPVRIVPIGAIAFESPRQWASGFSRRIG